MHTLNIIIIGSSYQTPTKLYTVPVAPLVLDIEYTAHQIPVIEGVAVLSDLDWAHLASHFPGQVHAEVDHEVEPLAVAPLLRITDNLRVFALLVLSVIPTAATETTFVKHFLVPFLVDTGSPTTFFTEKTTKKLLLDTADLIEVHGNPVPYRAAVGHFADVNLLGTDVLKACQLWIDYPNAAGRLDCTAGLHIVKASNC